MRVCTEDESLEAEQEAIYEALNNFNKLGFGGGLSCVNSKCAAYKFGEMLNETHTRLLVRKSEACFNFYNELLGLPHVGGNQSGPYAEFNTDTHFLALFDRQRMAEVIDTAYKLKDVDCQDRVALIFEVKDVDATYDHLKKQGLEFVTKPTDRPAWGLRTSHLRDPDGNLIELYTNRPDIYIP